MRSVLLVCALLACSCRTRPWDLSDAGDAGDAGIADLAPLPPDLTVPRDLRVIPDLTPGPDLLPPHYCDGIFVFDENKHLYFFDPKKLTFTDVAALACPTMGNPFSMAVARDGIAWVEYDTGQLFLVDTYTGACKGTSFVPNQNGYNTFGMGFASNAAGSTDETLFVADDSHDGNTGLATIDTKTLVLGPISSLPGEAELTGTGAGELWGFFGTAQPFVARINQTNGTTDMIISVAAAIGDATQAAYAFGAFGGNFYIFLSQPNQKTTVYRVDGATGTTSAVLRNTGRLIVGAGVSTCAPGN